MTEAEWLSSDDPGPMLEFLPQNSRWRKMRLFAVACCRHLEPLMTDGCHTRAAETSARYTQALETSEDYADVMSSKAALRRARQAVRKVRNSLDGTREDTAFAWAALWLAEVTASENAFDCFSLELRRLIGLGMIPSGRRPPECDLLRCLVNPFRNIPIDPAWLTEGVTSLARAIYDGRDFDSVPILGDALEEAGCDDPDIRYHCRAATVHAHGCWVVDSVRGYR